MTEQAVCIPDCRDQGQVYNLCSVFEQSCSHFSDVTMKSHSCWGPWKRHEVNGPAIVRTIQDPEHIDQISQELY